MLTEQRTNVASLPVTKGDLLKGRGTGAPLFIAWCIGVGTFYLLNVVINQMASGFSSMWYGLLASLLLLSIWEGILLFSSSWRRILWALVFLTTSFLLSVGSFLSSPSIQGLNIHLWPSLFFAQMFQGALLIKQRKRVWLWFGLAIVGRPEWNPLERPTLAAFEWFWSNVPFLLPTEFHPSYEDCYIYGHQIAFGLLAALFMPPVTKTPEHKEGTKESL